MITKRPDIWGAVGGVLPNPLTYVIQSETAFVTINLYKLNGDLITQVKKRTTGGIAEFDVSAFLKTLVAQLLDEVAGIRADFSATIAYYIDYSLSDGSGTFITDKPNLRYAANAALDEVDSNYAPWVIYRQTTSNTTSAITTTAAPTTTIPVTTTTTAPPPTTNGVSYRLWTSVNPTTLQGVCSFPPSGPVSGVYGTTYSRDRGLFIGQELFDDPSCTIELGDGYWYVWAYIMPGTNSPQGSPAKWVKIENGIVIAMGTC